MKKLLSLLLVMIMLITTLASCSLVEQFFPKKDETPVDTVDREVTEEEWNENMNIRNFERYSYYTRTQSGESETGEDVIFKCTESAYAIIDPEDGRIIDIGALKDGVWYEVDKRENGYVGYIIYEYSYGTVRNVAAMDDVIFANYTYNAELGAYVTQYNMEDLFPEEVGEMEIRVYFENKVIVKFEVVGYYVEDDGSRVDYVITTEIRNIGTTVIDVPEFTIHE